MDYPGAIEISSDDEAAIASAKRAAAKKAKAKRHAKKAATEAAAAAAAAANKIVMRRGTRTKVCTSFDKCCVYGNKVALKRTQVLSLRKLARKKHTLKVYACTMHLSNTKEPKAKMWFPRAYTNVYIKWYKELPAKLRVFCRGHVPIEVTMIMSKGKRQGAQIMTNWSQVVLVTEMQHSDIFMFRFRRSPRDGLKLLVQPVM